MHFNNINYSHHAVHDIFMTYLSGNWKFLPFSPSFLKVLTNGLETALDCGLGAGEGVVS